VPTDKTLASEGEDDGAIIAFIAIIMAMGYFFSRPTPF
tara:strand:- start:1638 stop:1751 length:114 start_codon:yes stop_codon:yes gene_type:complete